MTTTAYVDIGREQFEATVKRLFTLDEVEVIMAAYKFSKGAHSGVPRKDGVTRYFEHPKTVAWILIELGCTDWELIAIALLHDVLEDTWLLSPMRIEVNFGRKVRVGVEDISKRDNESHAEYLSRMLAAGVNWRVWLVKLADRLHNLRTLDACSEEQQIAKRAETRELYLPRFNLIEVQTPSEHRQAVHYLCEQITALCA